jgi:hypothetical protein
MEKPYIVTLLRPLRKKEVKKLAKNASHVAVLTIAFSSELEAKKTVESMVLNELHEDYKVILSYEPEIDNTHLN